MYKVNSWSVSKIKYIGLFRLSLNFEFSFQLEIIDACVSYIESLQTQLNVVQKSADEDDDETADNVDDYENLLNNNNDEIEQNLENEDKENKSDFLWKWFGCHLVVKWGKHLAIQNYYTAFVVIEIKKESVINEPYIFIVILCDTLLSPNLSYQYNWLDIYIIVRIHW